MALNLIGTKPHTKGNRLLQTNFNLDIISNLERIKSKLNNLVSSDFSIDSDLDFNGYSGINIDELGASGARINKIWMEEFDLLYPGSVLGSKSFNLLYNDTSVNYGLTFTASGDTLGQAGGHIRSQTGSLYFGTASTNYFKVTSTAFSALGSYDLGTSGQYFSNAYISNLYSNTTITGSYATASRAAIFNSNKEIVNSSVTDTELGYLSGVTSEIQTQFNGKGGLSTDNIWTGINTFNSWLNNAINKPYNIYRYHSNSNPLVSGDNNLYHKIATFTIDVDNEYYEISGIIGNTSNGTSARPENIYFICKIRLQGTLSSGTLDTFLSYRREGTDSNIGTNKRLKLVKTSDTVSSKIYELYLYINSASSPRTYDIKVASNLTDPTVAFNQITTGAGLSAAGVAALGTLTDAYAINNTYSMNSNVFNYLAYEALTVGSSTAEYLFETYGEEHLPLGIKFSHFVTKTIANTTTRTNGFNTTSNQYWGNNASADNTVKAGTVMELHNSGFISTTSGSQNLTIEVAIGSTVILGTTIAVPGSLTDVEYRIHAMVTIRTTGATGTAIAYLEISINNVNYNVATNTDTTIDTTASMTWGIYYKWATANASNSVRVVQGALKRG